MNAPPTTGESVDEFEDSTAQSEETQQEREESLWHGVSRHNLARSIERSDDETQKAIAIELKKIAQEEGIL